jgi:hypothetical protein
MSHLSNGEIVIKLVNESHKITNYGNILSTSNAYVVSADGHKTKAVQISACNKNRQIHQSIIPIVAEHTFKSHRIWDLQIELSELLKLSYKILLNVGIDVLDPSLDEGYRTKLKTLVEWCKEMSKDHNHFYLIDRVAYGYEVYFDGDKKVPFHEFNNRTFDNFEKLEFGSSPRGPRHDMIYDDTDFKIIVMTKEGVKRNKRIELNKAVQDSIDINQFVYCEV